MSTLYVVATPIGNLEDITLRAIRILRDVDAILCEDTRVTAKLLQKYEIQKTLISYHSHSKLSKVEKVFEFLEAGKDLALVSDAGTPCISDPGVMLVSQVREKFSDMVKIVAVPGPSAVISALSGSGLPSSEFLFLGFLPHKKGRETLFKEIASSGRTVAFYESPHRIIKALESLQKFAPEKKIVIARELTKIYEEFIEGTATELLAHFEKHPDTIRGEFVVMVANDRTREQSSNKTTQAIKQ
ncbi:MAG: 16S rRNA (cytidine(1402)-2'-O)-methyltransferase [Candidatus Paceibacterota bacterium]|jgi:16S rRNA (cytidine1402-2'-O)-methyltransferase|nr:16S rRNA (cytidine(1402)-2'-O)-methyltransferase [Candidatus Paceibacterota bacterium]